MCSSFVLQFVVYFSITVHVVVSATDRLPIVFVYTVVPAVCKFGLPLYIRVSVEQSIYTQPDCDVFILGNIGECAAIKESVKDVAKLMLVDSVSIESNRTGEFRNLSRTMFVSDGSNELWITSALRFFMLEDLMLNRGWSEMMHVEADNMLYGRYTTLLPILRQYYPLAATPLNSQKSFITASVLWVNSMNSMRHFNDYLLRLGHNTDSGWDKYLAWLRHYACCKPGGIAPDKFGQGIKPFAVNEMSMLAHYHELYPDRLRLLPVVPNHPYNLNRHIIDINRFSSTGSEIVAPTGVGIWDANSWGQWLGGTSNKKGRDKHFTDPSHISGLAIRTTQCIAAMLCANITEFGFMNSTSFSLPKNNEERRCYTAPFVTCLASAKKGYKAGWTPLWNLHVHAKHTQDFRSKVCSCQGGMEQLLS